MMSLKVVLGFVEDFVWAPLRSGDLGLASFGESDTYDHADAAGFIKLFGLPARVGGDLDRASEDVRERVRELLDASAVI